MQGDAKSPAQGWGRAGLVAVASRECCDLSRGREAFSHHKYIQEGERHMLGTVIRTRGWVGKELQEVWVDASCSWVFLCASSLVRYPALDGRSLDSKIPVSVKSGQGKLSTTREMGSEPYHQ